MNKRSLFVSCFLGIILAFVFGNWSVSMAQVKFKDVPADHWAAKSVYDLVKLGVTEGYPDQTFRGKKTITRFETSIFLSKLAEKLGGTDLAQLKKDISDIKDDIVKSQGISGTPLSGDFEMNAKTANILASNGTITGRGPLMNYRLNMALSQDLKQGNSLKINFDTMDSGFMGATRELVSEMIDVTGVFKINPVDLGLYDFGAPLDLSITMGPGPIKHTDLSGILPSENNFVYERPYSGINLSTNIFGVNTSGSYLQIAKNLSGLSTTSLFRGNLKYDSFTLGKIEKINLGVEGDYYVKHPSSGGTRDIRGKIDLGFVFSPKLTVNTNIGIGGSTSKTMMVAGELWLIDPINTGTTLMFGGSKIGSEFISAALADDEFNVAGYDLFMRPLINSTDNVNVQIVQTISDKLTFTAKGSFRLASDFTFGPDKVNSLSTVQAGLSYEVVKSAILNLYYRINQDPTISESTDLFSMGLLYKF